MHLHRHFVQHSRLQYHRQYVVIKHRLQLLQFHRTTTYVSVSCQFCSPRDTGSLHRRRAAEEVDSKYMMYVFLYPVSLVLFVSW